MNQPADESEPPGGNGAIRRRRERSMHSRPTLPRRVLSYLLAAAVTLACAVAVVGLFGLFKLLTDPGWIEDRIARCGAELDRWALLLPPPLPERRAPQRTIWLSQGWGADDRYWFHHASQGTATFPLPYDWFVSLEQPRFTLGGLFGSVGLMCDADYLARLGFLRSPLSSRAGNADTSTPESCGNSGVSHPDSAADTGRSRPDGDPRNDDLLPIGFARLAAGTDPRTGKPFPDQIGFTCSACHTGSLTYEGTSIRFDGGPAMVDLGKLERVIGLAIGYTEKNYDGRLGRFLDRLKQRNPQLWADEDKVKSDLSRTLRYIQSRLEWQRRIVARKGHRDVPEGFGRLDALTRIGNQVFFDDLLPLEVTRCWTQPDPNSGDCAQHMSPPRAIQDNYAAISAPVSFPPVWDVPWFTWAQYDASILNPLVRNAGEALGVRAKVNLVNKQTGLFRSSVDFDNLRRFEKLLAGDNPFSQDGQRRFTGLRAPKWPAAHFAGDPAWQVDPMLVKQGRKLYRTHCYECHRGPVDDPVFDEDHPGFSFWDTTNPDRDAPNWISAPSGGKKFFNVVQKRVPAIGTDPEQARILARRRVRVPDALGLDVTGYLNTRWNCGLPENVPGQNSFYALALMAVTGRVIDAWQADNRDAAITSDPRPNCPNMEVFRVWQAERAHQPVTDTVAMAGSPGAAGVQRTVRGPLRRVSALPVYRARPLDGVWATAPYLHNGSVPTLWDLLLPAGERPARFCVGSTEFDPIRVGLVRQDGAACARGLTRFDATERGSSNAGHSFEWDEKTAGAWSPQTARTAPAGVIGPVLSDADRRALIAYLKTL